MKKCVILVLILFSVTGIYAQTSTVLFPSNLNVQPFTANFLEPKLGFFFQMNNNELRLDVGNSSDIVHFRTNSGMVVSAGADLFTYTLLRGEKDFHFPVDAIDYLFGLNAAIKKSLGKGSEYGLRFRLSHISAHFVDGHYDGTHQQWRDNRTPRVYSREFIEFIPFYYTSGLRVYAGYTYLFHVDPADLGQNVYQAGFDYYLKNIISSSITPFAAYDLRLAEVGKYRGNNSLMAGIKFGNPPGRGFSVFYKYYSGKSIHGEYHDYDEEYSALGFNLDL